MIYYICFKIFVDLDPDPDSTSTLDPDPDPDPNTTNPDPKHCFFSAAGKKINTNFSFDNGKW